MQFYRPQVAAASLRALLTSLALLASPAAAQWSADTTLGRLRLDRELLLRLPLRTLTDINTLIPGAAIHERRSYGYAGQPWEQVLTVDGISLHDPFTGTPAVQLIPEGLAGMTLHRSAFGADRAPAAPSELAFDLLRGGEEFTFALHASTDGLGDPGTKFLGATSQGSQQINAVASGSILPGLRFATAATLNATENRQPMYLARFKAGGLTTDNLGMHPAGVPLPGTISFEENFLPHNGLTAAAAQGRLDWDLSPLSIALTFALNRIDAPLENDWPSALENYYRRDRALVLEQRSELVALSGRLSPDDATTIDASAAYIGSRQRTADPDFGERWQLYVDSAANAQRGYGGFTSMYGAPYAYSTILQFYFSHEHTPNNRYARSQVSGWQMDLRARSETAEGISVNAGVHHEFWTGRAFSLSNISSFMPTAYGPDGRTPASFASESERQRILTLAGQMFLVGTDVDGRDVDDGPDAPATPSTTSAFAEATFSGAMSRGTLGLQVVTFQPGISSSSQRTSLFLPRATAYLDLGSGLAWEFATGFFASLAPLWNILTQQKILGVTTAPPGDYVDYLYDGRLPLTSVEPSRTWMFESAATFRSDLFSARLGGFFRTESGRFAEGSIYSTSGVPFFGQWQEKSTVTLYGFQSTVDVRPLSIVSLRGWYAWHSSDEVETLVTGGFPGERHPASRNHQVRGILSIHSAGTDRFGDDGLYAVAIYSGTIGYSYRRIAEPASLGQSTVWNIGIRGVMDPRSRIAVSSEDDRMPFAHRVDLHAGGMFTLGGVRMEAYVSIYNLFDRREVLAVYPNTGRSDDDGWLSSPYAVAYNEVPFYTPFYAAINLANRWAFMKATGTDIYGEPRQVMVGMRVVL